jgi:type I restriction enzyme R subunit
MAQYNIIAENENYTIVSDYQAVYRTSEKYQTEAQLEQELIKTLTEQGYDYLAIHKEQDLVDNLRVQLQRLNDYTFTDSEWKRFFNDVIANQNEASRRRPPRYRKTISKFSKETLAKPRIST